MNQRTSFAPSLAAVLLAAGALQLLAITWLGTHSRARVEYVARVGPLAYLFGGAVLSLLAFFAWKQRHKPKHALFILVGGLIVTGLALRGKINRIGVVYHAEFVLHHFLALLSAAACVAVPWSWLQRDRAGAGPRARGLVPLALAGVAGVSLLSLHLCDAVGLQHAALRVVRVVGAAAAFASWLTGLALYWRQLAPRLRALALALAGVVVVRLALAGPQSLLGATVDGHYALPMIGLLVSASAAALLLLRPGTTVLPKLIAAVFSASITTILAKEYFGRFGEIESDLGGLARSLVGFQLPYPDYVPLWLGALAALAFFALIASVVNAILSETQRLVGLALGLVLVTGFGLREPQLVLMHAAAFWLLLEALSSARAEPTTALRRAPPAPLQRTAAALAQRLGLGAKGLVTLEQERGTLVAVRGSLHGARDIPLDLRARGSDELGWDVRVELGVVGRERPRLELRPDPRVEPGQHSPLITTRHRVVGDTRTLEIYDEGLFDALARFPDHRARFWDAGVSVELGRDLAALDPDALEELITQLARAC